MKLLMKLYCRIAGHNFTVESFGRIEVHMCIHCGLRKSYGLIEGLEDWLKMKKVE